MQVSVESSTGLEKRMVIELPAQPIEDEIQGRLKSLAHRVRLDGFRPGKVPFKVVVQKFGQQVRQEVCQEMAQSSFYRAASEKNLRPAGRPTLELGPTESGQTLNITAVFEVYPEVKIANLADISIKKPVAEISEQDIDNMIEKLRKQRVEWITVSRAAQKGDRVLVDFKGEINGQDFAGNAAQDYALVLGDGAMIPGFEDNLMGVKAGESRSFGIAFPETYQSKELAGKPVTFHVTLKSVAEPKLPEVDAAFIASFGIKDGDLPSFRLEVGETMRREIDQIIKDVVKRQVMEGLLAHISFDLPKVLVDDEISRMSSQLRYEMAMQGQKMAAEELPAALFEAQAQRRVSLGLIFAEIIKERQLKADPAKIREAIENLAASYENPPEVVQWYYASQDRLRGVEALQLEDQAVDWVLSQAKVVDESSSYDDLIAQRRA